MQTRSHFRLLIVRLGAMGDILHALPAVTALRRKHPTWQIGWLVDPRWRALLTADGSNNRHVGCCTDRPNPAQPLVDRLHFADTKLWRKAPFSAVTRAAIRDLKQELRAEDYSVTLDLQGNLRSAVLGSFACARRHMGEAAPREALAKYFFNDRVLAQGDHVIEQDVELAEALAGDELEPVLPALPVDPVAESIADQLVASDRPAVLINPGAGWGAKRWPVERYAEVARRLAAEGCQILVNAGPGEAELAQVIVSATAGAGVVLNVSVAGLISVTRRVRLLIAGDTGPLHLACALGKPVVGVYGPTDPRRNGPYHSPSIVLRSPESRRDHSRRPDPEAGLLTIQPDDVYDAALQLLYSGIDRTPQEKRLSE